MARAGVSHFGCVVFLSLRLRFVMGASSCTCVDHLLLCRFHSEVFGFPPNRDGSAGPARAQGK